MNYLKIYRESNKKYYEFYIEWNTGDMYWDNIPATESFFGTIEELEAYLSQENAPPADFEKLLLSGDTIYDAGGETWSVQIVKKISSSEYEEWKAEREAEIKREEEERLAREKDFQENYWHSEEEAIAAVQHLISADSISYANPTPNHSDRVSHYDDCGFYVGKDYTNDDRLYYAVFIEVYDPNDSYNRYTELKKPGPEAEIYKTWVDQLKRGPKERHETEASASWEYNYRSGRITKKNVNMYQTN